ncbi:MAG: GNAT family N-acetyltransferase [Chloroflexota bacterium]
MQGTPYTDEPLGNRPRRGFHCGIEALDRYFGEQITQDQRRNLARPYVLVDTAKDNIVGFYTLSSFTIRRTSLPPDRAKGLPAYEAYPSILIGRLAVDHRYQGRGLGRLLLANALRRCRALSEQVGAMAVVVDAKDEKAHAFYKHHGFLPLADHPNRLYLPMRSLQGPAGGAAR